MGERSSTSRGSRLDLNNSHSAHAERSRCVLTGPRSLESCTRLGIKPVDLLIKSLNRFVAERRDRVPCEAVRAMHDFYERERLKLSQMCREERRIIRDRWPGTGGNKVEPDHKGDRDTTGPITYADLCFKGEPASRSSCRSTVCSFTLGDLTHTPQTEKELERLAGDVRRQTRVPVSERDRKIAALMLVKHQEEQTGLELRAQEERRREEARRCEEARRREEDVKKESTLRWRMRRWQEELEARRRLRARREGERAGQVELEVLLQEDRKRRLTEEVEEQRREKTEAAQKEAGCRKRHQEKLLREKEEVEKRERERERRVAWEKEEKARRSRGSREEEERRRLQEGNRRELLRHLLLRQQVEQQVVEEEARARSELEEKLRRSREAHARAAEARLTGLRERAAREEERVRGAQQRAALQRHRQLVHRLTLGQRGQRRSERAARCASARRRSREQETRGHNEHRRLGHQRRREEVQRVEEAERRVREGWVFMKDWRRERLRRRREEVQEEGRRRAQASFHMRDRVRQRTHRRTFDQMALEAQLSASLSRMELGKNQSDFVETSRT